MLHPEKFDVNALPWEPNPPELVSKILNKE
jgi:hypothetical protein